MHDHSIKQIINLIQKSQRIIVMPSSPPDGDSIGSAIACYEVLKKLGKEVSVVCADSVPDVLHFLPKNEIIRHKFNPARDFVVTLDCSQKEVDNVRYNVEKDKVNIIITPKSGSFSPEDVLFNYGPTKWDLIITVDTATLGQLGVLYEGNIDFFYNTPVINIDHHASNEYFGKVNLVDVTAASTTEILLNIFQEMEVEEKLIDDDIATLLLAGLITDTGSFQNANTTPKSFAVAAKLLKMGARQQEIIKNIYKTKELSTLKLWGAVLSKLQYDRPHKIVWSTISIEEFLETESKSEDTGGIIDELMSNAPGAEIIVLMKEKEPDLISCSMRTTSPAINASNLAAHFGGGGHPQAAGFRIKGKSLAEAELIILNYLRKEQEKRGIGVIIDSEFEDIEEDEQLPELPQPKTPKVEPKPEVEEHVEEEKSEENSEQPEKHQEPKELENPLAELIGNAEDQEENPEDPLNKMFYKFDS